MKDPAMLFYTSDFLTGVTLLSMKERGQYITLLCLQQQMGHMSLEQMYIAVGKMSPALLSKFIQDEEGLYYNRRAEEEIIKRQTHCDKQRENVNKRWKKDTTDIPQHNDGITVVPTTVIPLENENENTSITSSVKVTREEQFNDWWSVYPKKVGKGAARKSFFKLPASVIPLLIPATEKQKNSQQWKKDGGIYIPNPATWLNQGRWEDELPEGELEQSYDMLKRWSET